MVVFGKSPHGGDIYTNKIKIDFSANINPLGLPDSIKEAIINNVNSLESYPDPYCNELRKAISIKEDVEFDHIICGNGAAELIYSLFNTFYGKKALIVGPTFLEYEKALKCNNINFDYYLLKEEDGFLLNDKFTNYLDKNYYDLIILNNPNNPTGLLVDDDLLIRILKKIKEINSFLFIDECFMDLVSVNHSLVKYIKDYPNLFILKAFTKSYAMPGIRLGYGICSNHDIINKMSDNTQVWNVSSIAQICGVAALKEVGFLNKSISYIEKEKEYLLSNLRKFGFVCYEGTANYIFFKAIKDLDTMLLKRGIMIRNCSNYISLTDCYYRIAVRTHEENMELIRNIKELLNG